jgi:hypothetical protein
MRIKKAISAGMQYGLREGDWVLHRSCPEPVRVIGLGSTIAVELPNGVMRAFEPSELKKVAPVKVPRPKVPVHQLRHDRGIGWAEWFALVTSLVLICLIALVLAMLAGVGP